MRSSAAPPADDPPAPRPPRSADEVRRRRAEARRRTVTRRWRFAAALVLLVAAAAAVAVAVAVERPDPEREQAVVDPAASPVAAADRVTRAAGARSSTPAKRRRTPPRTPGKKGSLVAVPGTGPLLGGGGPVSRFVIELEGGLRIDRDAFTRTVERVLGDPRGWSRSGTAFRRVPGGSVNFRVTLASATTTNELCRPLQTNGIFSCYMNGRAVLNFSRWKEGAASYGSDLSGYRIYMVNHEVGHALGHGHAWCPEAGARAPVMVQQTKGVVPCRRNPWPLPSEAD